MKDQPITRKELADNVAELHSDLNNEAFLQAERFQELKDEMQGISGRLTSLQQRMDSFAREAREAPRVPCKVKIISDKATITLEKGSMLGLSTTPSPFY